MGEDRVRRGLLKEIVKVEESYSLKAFSPLGTGGVADFFCVANSTVEMAAAVKAATDLQVPYLVVGQGGRVIFSDGGFPGLVIHNRAESYAFAHDKSQCVVDSGMSLRRFITLAAGHGLGGLTHLYGETDTVGGALYANVRGPDEGQQILSSVRYATMLMPPTRIEKEATIARYKPEWFKKAEQQTRLQGMRAELSYDVPQPVILTVMFQLTRVRTDELLTRLNARSREDERQRPRQSLLGPVFHPVPGVDVSELLTGAGVAALKVGDAYVDRHFPNYIASRGSRITAQDIRELIGQMQAQVAKVYGVELTCRYEYLGVW